MSTTSEKIIGKAVNALKKSIPTDEWVLKEKVLAAIPEKLADEAIGAFSSPLAVNDLSKEDRVEMGRTKLFEKLVESKHLEERDDEGVIQVRFAGTIDADPTDLSPANDKSANQVQEPRGATGLPSHPVAAMFPLLSGEEFDRLREDIHKNGLHEPIVTHEGMVVDGRNRDRVLKDLGMAPQAVAWDGKGSVVDFIVSKNLVRRHLDESQRAMVAAEIKKQYDQEAKVETTRANLPAGRARDRAAKLLNVSGRSVGSAEVVQRNGIPELQDAVKDGRVSVSAAAQCAKQPPAKQKEALAKGPEGIKELARAERNGPPNGDETLQERVAAEQKIIKAFLKDLERSEEMTSMQTLADKWPDNRYSEILPELRQLRDLKQTLATVVADLSAMLEIDDIINRFNGQLKNGSETSVGDSAATETTSKANAPTTGHDKAGPEVVPAKAASRKRSSKRKSA